MGSSTHSYVENTWQCSGFSFSSDFFFLLEHKVHYKIRHLDLEGWEPAKDKPDGLWVLEPPKAPSTQVFLNEGCHLKNGACLLADEKWLWAWEREAWEEPVSRCLGVLDCQRSSLGADPTGWLGWCSQHWPQDWRGEPLLCQVFPLSPSDLGRLRSPGRVGVAIYQKLFPHVNRPWLYLLREWGLPQQRSLKVNSQRASRLLDTRPAAAGWWGTHQKDSYLRESHSEYPNRLVDLT